MHTMNTIAKSPVNIIQELVGIHTTRREAYSRMKEKSDDHLLNEQLGSIVGQSESFIAELMNELSQFGDAISGEVDRDNEFNNLWKDALNTFENMQTIDFKQTFVAMENSLPKIYGGYLDSSEEFTESLRSIIEKQARQVGESIKS